MNWIKSHKGAVAVMAAIGLSGLVFAVLWFQPQTLFIDDVVNDTIPVAAAQQDPVEASSPSEEEESNGETAESEAPMDDQTTADEPVDAEAEMPSVSTDETPTEEQPSYPLTLGSGAFIDLEHTGSGVAKILELEDGSRILRLEDLDVSNGPDLRVILSDSELVDDLGAYDDGLFVDLGPLKGNKGNQNYEIPADVDLDDFATVAIWCRRFNATFNAAPINP